MVKDRRQAGHRAAEDKRFSMVLQPNWDAPNVLKVCLTQGPVPGGNQVRMQRHSHLSLQPPNPHSIQRRCRASHCPIRYLEQSSMM